MTWYSRKTPSYGFGGGFMKIDNLTFYIKPNTPFQPHQNQENTKATAAKPPRKRKSPFPPKPKSKKVKTQSEKKTCKPTNLKKQIVSVSKNNFI